MRQQLLNTAVQMRRKSDTKYVEGKGRLTGGAMEGAGGELPCHFICSKMP